MKCVAPVCSGSTNGSKRLPVALWSKPASKFLGIEMFLELPCTTSSQGLWGHQQTWLSLPSISWGFFHPAHIPGPQAPRAISLCPSGAAAGLLPSSPQLCPAWPWPCCSRGVPDVMGWGWPWCLLDALLLSWALGMSLQSPQPPSGPGNSCTFL